MEEEKTTEVKPDYSVNWMVFWVLVILTIGEFYLGVASGGRREVAIFMWFFALIKAGFIVANYMNLGRLFWGGEDH